MWKLELWLQRLQVGLGNRIGLFLWASRVAVWVQLLSVGFCSGWSYSSVYLPVSVPWLLLFSSGYHLGWNCYQVFRGKGKKTECPRAGQPFCTGYQFLLHLSSMIYCINPLPLAWAAAFWELSVSSSPLKNAFKCVCVCLYSKSLLNWNYLYILVCSLFLFSKSYWKLPCQDKTVVILI